MVSPSCGDFASAHVPPATHCISTAALLALGILLAAPGFVVAESPQPQGRTPSENQVAPVDTPESLDELEEIKELKRVTFESPVKWFLNTDIGLVHAYVEDQLITYDISTGNEIGSRRKIPNLKKQEIVHLPATNILVVLESDSNIESPTTTVASVAEDGATPGGNASAGAKNKGDKHSLAIDAFNSELLWRNQPLPLTQVIYPVYDRQRVVLHHGFPGPAELTAFDILSGDHSWNHEISASSVIPTDDVLQVLGCRSTAFDAGSGQVIWQLTLADDKEVLRCDFAKSKNRSIVVSKKQLRGLAFAPPPDELPTEPSEAEVIPSQLWELAVKEKAPRIHVAGDEVFIHQTKNKEQLRSLTDGTVLWSREISSPEQSLRPSRSGTKAVSVDGKTLELLDLETGQVVFKLEPKVLAERKKHSLVTVEWEADDKAFIVWSRDPKGTAVARISVEEGRELWAAIAPPPAKYRLTGKEKGKIFGRVLLSVAAVGVGVYGAGVAAGAANAAQVTRSATQLIQLGLQGVFTTIADSRALRERSRTIANAGYGLAFERYRDRISRVKNPSEVFFITGLDDKYEIIAADLDTGQKRLVARYEQEKVHDMLIDVPYQVVVSLENNNRDLVFGSLPDYVPLDSDSPLIPEKTADLNAGLAEPE